MALARLGVKSIDISNIDPAKVERKEEDELFRQLQFINFRTKCTVFLIHYFAEVFLISLQFILQGQNMCGEESK